MQETQKMRGKWERWQITILCAKMVQTFRKTLKHVKIIEKKLKVLNSKEHHCHFQGTVSNVAWMLKTLSHNKHLTSALCMQQGLLLTCWKHSHWRHIFLASQEELSCLVRHQGRLWCEFHHTLIHNHQSQLRDGKRSFYRVETVGSLLETELMPTKAKHFTEDSEIHHITQSHSHLEWE